MEAQGIQSGVYFQMVTSYKTVKILEIREKEVSCTLQGQGKDMNEGRLETYPELENTL